MLVTQLTDFCGAGVPGGSAEMVTRFSNAGNLGANIWGWAEKIVSLDMNKKGTDWEAAVDAVLASYTNRMNLACGDNLQLNTVAHTSSASNQPTALQTAAALAVSMAFPGTENHVENPYENWSLYMDVTSHSEVYSYNDANQVVMAALSKTSKTARRANMAPKPTPQPGSPSAIHIYNRIPMKTINGTIQNNIVTFPFLNQLFYRNNADNSAAL